MHYLDDSINVIRLHPEDLYHGKITQTGIDGNITIEVGKTKISTDDTGVAWLRKWGNPPLLQTMVGKNTRTTLDVLNAHIFDEYCVFFNFLVRKITLNKHTYWFNNPFYVSPNKLHQLEIAQKAGLKIPHTILRNQLTPEDLQKKMITKNLSEMATFSSSHNFYSTYTSQVKNVNFKEHFFVSLFQEEIEKELELRVLYIDGICYAMAIFSQENSQTKTDYRRYDYENENRMELFRLPQNINEAIVLFMNLMNLQTGSLDLILDKNGDYIFLEVNPSGQYDLFNNSNIQPDKLIAQHLIKKHYEYRH
ncbi:hypothetical protein LJC68_07320 [Bacteroidales bacterium OttesenSCG-928-B11]|nr:hypothetical protein [Bacteroidales bacterium OttesenSCG-928-B11]